MKKILTLKYPRKLILLPTHVNILQYIYMIIYYRCLLHYIYVLDRSKYNQIFSSEEDVLLYFNTKWIFSNN